MKRLLFTVLLVAGFWPGSARAAPYWVAWEGNDYPENEGWERQFVHGGADRSLVDGSLRIDSTRNHQIYDQSVTALQFDPAQGELFVAEWRVRVSESTGPNWDQALGISTEQDLVAFGFYSNAVVSMREGWTISVEPAVFHVFRLESTDLSTYSFFVDGAIAIGGTFEPTTIGPSGLSFGDSRSGGGITSIADWDYVRFGVVPEPSSVMCVVACLAVTQLWRRS